MTLRAVERYEKCLRTNLPPLLQIKTIGNLDLADICDRLLSGVVMRNGCYYKSSSYKSQETKIFLSTRPLLLLILNITGRIVTALNHFTNTVLMPLL
jgi:hypothetical protein